MQRIMTKSNKLQSSDKSNGLKDVFLSICIYIQFKVLNALKLVLPCTIWWNNHTYFPFLQAHVNPPRLQWPLTLMTFFASSFIYNLTDHTYIISKQNEGRKLCFEVTTIHDHDVDVEQFTVYLLYHKGPLMGCSYLKLLSSPPLPLQTHTHSHK